VLLHREIEGLGECQIFFQPLSWSSDMYVALSRETLMTADKVKDEREQTNGTK